MPLRGLPVGELADVTANMIELDPISLKSSGNVGAFCSSCSCSLNPFALLDFSFDCNMLLCPFCLSSDICISIGLDGGGNSA